MPKLEAAIKIQGITAIHAVFDKLPKKVRNKAMRPALKKGAQVVLKNAAANEQAVVSDKATGLLGKSLRVYALRNVRGNLRVAVMVKRGLMSLKGVRVGLYAGVLEYGKKNQPPRSWLRKAARESTSEVFNAIEAEAEKRMRSAVEDAKK